MQTVVNPQEGALLIAEANDVALFKIENFRGDNCLDIVMGKTHDTGVDQLHRSLPRQATMLARSEHGVQAVGLFDEAALVWCNMHGLFTFCKEKEHIMLDCVGLPALLWSIT